MTSLSPDPAPLDLGEPLAAGFAIYLRAFLPFSAVALALSLPTILWSIIVLESPSPAAVQAFRFGATTLSLVLSALTTAILVHATFTIIRGREIQLVASFQAAFKHVVPLLGTAILAALVIILGFFAFIVPGLIAMAILYVAIPACLVEGLTPVDALKRSAALTAGNRWPVFGIAAILAVIPGGTTALLDHLLEEGSLEIGLYFVVGTAVQVMFAGLAAAVTTVVYYRLRQRHGPVDLDRITGAFD